MSLFDKMPGFESSLKLRGYQNNVVLISSVGVILNMKEIGTSQRKGNALKIFFDFFN